jgi:hypothetical protein
VDGGHEVGVEFNLNHFRHWQEIPKPL